MKIASGGLWYHGLDRESHLGLFSVVDLMEVHSAFECFIKIMGAHRAARGSHF